MDIDRISLFRRLYIGSIIILFFGLVFSKLAISLAQFSLLAVWFLEKDYNSKFKRLKQDIPALIFLSIFTLFLIGILWTDNFDAGLKALKLKLPILVIPFLISSSKPISKKELKILLFSFIVIVFAKSIQSLIIFISNEYISSIQKLNPKISHIRLSLIIDFAIFATIYLLRKDFFTKSSQKYISILVILWFIVSLFIIQSVTGFVILIIVILALSTAYFFRLKNKHLKYFFLFITIIIPIALIIYINYQFQDFYTFKDPNYNDLPEYTEQGNKYTHDSTNIYIENGYYVGYYLCEKELKKEWNERSTIKYDSTDINGYKIKYTLKRYLTSLGLPKDSTGVKSLTDKDIKSIEKSISNVRFNNKININNRIYKIIWQFHIYLKTKNPNNQSLTQRIEFTKTAINIIKKNTLFGVGTGDLKQAFADQYIEDNSKLEQKNRYTTHNQYISFIVVFGVILGTWCILALFLPFFINKKYKEFLPSIFFIIAMFSMLNEDTLETSIGISFFTIFYSLLILQKLKE
ncbi:MAG: O-antigen ligase family protein [Bacteroidales bacterium]|nr:O-antigen ligase family protein [Bacteroidales bacterium]